MISIDGGVDATLSFNYSITGDLEENLDSEFEYRIWGAANEMEFF